MYRALISPQRLYEQSPVYVVYMYSSFSGIMMSRSELRLPGDQLHAWGPHLRKAATKVAILGVTEDQGAQMKTKAK